MDRSDFASSRCNNPNLSDAGTLVDAYEQVRNSDPKPLCKTHEDSHSRIPLAALDASYVGQREAAGVGHLLLGESAFGTDSEDVSAEAVERIASHDGIVVAWGRSALELISLEGWVGCAWRSEAPARTCACRARS